MTPWQRVQAALAAEDRARVVCGDAVEELYLLEPESVDVVFADPPYFLSRAGGTTCRGGKGVSVVKGEWDKPRDRDQAIAFSTCWLAAVQRALKPSGTVWICGTSHVIRAVEAACTALRMPPINDVVWEKPSPPPNLACRSLTHSHETLLWRKRDPKVWRMLPPRGEEKKRGAGHPTQKPVELVRRCLELSCPPGGLVVDPFAGSGTTGEAAAALGLRVVLIDADPESAARCLRRMHP